MCYMHQDAVFKGVGLVRVRDEWLAVWRHGSRFARRLRRVRVRNGVVAVMIKQMQYGYPGNYVCCDWCGHPGPHGETEKGGQSEKAVRAPKSCR